MSVLAGLCVANCSLAESAPQTDGRGTGEIRIREIFSSHLPDTMRKNSFRAFVHPHFGDFENHDYFRISSGVRYGATSKLELSAETAAYFSHGFGDVGFFDRKGVMSAQFGAKLNVGPRILEGWDASVGFDVTRPTGSPPIELTDGLQHFEPYMTFSRRMESRPEIRLFWGAGADLVSATRFAGELQENQLGDDSAHLTAGFVWDRDRLHYTFEAMVASTRPFGESSDDLLVLRPGVIWEIPSFRNPHSRGNWMIGVGAKASFGPDGADYGVSAKLRYNLDLKHLFSRKKRPD